MVPTEEIITFHDPWLLQPFAPHLMEYRDGVVVIELKRIFFWYDHLGQAQRNVIASCWGRSGGFFEEYFGIVKSNRGYLQSHDAI